MSIGPVFIVGMPRSGTTVFSRVFSKKTGILIAPETHFLREIYEKNKGINLEEEANINKVLDSFQHGRWFASLDLTIEEIKNDFIKSESNQWSGLFESVIRVHAMAKGASGWGEKTPGHYKNIEQLLEWYPDCKIIYLFRNPFDAIASNLKAPFAQSSVILNALRWKEVYRTYFQHSKDSRVFRVKYEDFVNSPDDVIVSITGDNSLAQYTPLSLPKMKSTGWRKSHLDRASLPLNTSSIGKGLNYLTSFDKWVITLILKRECKSLTYNVPRKQYHLGFGLKLLFSYGLDRLKAKARLSHLKKSECHDLSKLEKILIATSGIIEQLTFNFHKRLMIHKPQANETILCISLKKDEVLYSSYERLNSKCESIGLELLRNIDCNYKPVISYDNFEAFVSSRAILRSFGLYGKVELRFKYSANRDNKNELIK